MGDGGIYVVAAIILLILAALAVVRFAIMFQAFRRELTYLNNEIARTEGRERQHYIKRKKRLFLSLIPFVGY